MLTVGAVQAHQVLAGSIPQPSERLAVARAANSARQEVCPLSSPS